MNNVNPFALVLVVVGALINFLVPYVIKKKAEEEAAVVNTVYAVKIIGLLMVIAGAIMIFWLGGKFGG